MSELEEFMYLLHKHPEAIPALRDLAKSGASLPEQKDLHCETTE